MSAHGQEVWQEYLGSEKKKETNMEIKNSN
jgi:hypothetical protein